MATRRGLRIADCGLRIADLFIPGILLLLHRLLHETIHLLPIRNPQSAIHNRKILSMCALICAPLCAAAQAQSTPAQRSVAQSQSTPTQSSIKDPAARVTEAIARAGRLIAETLAIEDPAARAAALRKFLETNNTSEQTLAEREAIVTRWAQMAESDLGRSDVERGMEKFRRAVDGMPGRVTDRFFEETVIRIPFALSARGYRNEAIEMARELERRFAKEPPRLASLGEFYMTIEATGDAIRALETASKLAGEEAKLDRLLGAAYRMGLRLDDAIAEYQLAAGLDAKDNRAYYELANLYRAHGAYADAIELYRKQLEIAPKHSSSYKGLALAYLAQGDEVRMAAALDQARDLRGSAEEITGDLYLQTQLAFYYLAQDKLKQARTGRRDGASGRAALQLDAHRRRRSRPRPGKIFRCRAQPDRGPILRQLPDALLHAGQTLPGRRRFRRRAGTVLQSLQLFAAGAVHGQARRGVRRPGREPERVALARTSGGDLPGRTSDQRRDVQNRRGAGPIQHSSARHQNDDEPISNGRNRQ